MVQTLSHSTLKFFEELKKRNVYKAGAAYVVTGWLLLQIVDVVGPGFGWPESLTALITKILLVGFPIALVLAWLYELTPKGFKRTGTYQEDTADNKKAGRRLNYFIIGVLAVALCFMLVERVFFAGNNTTNDREASIAVLPFYFLSTADSLAFMSEALSGAISDKLGRVSGLSVIGKTSSSQFKDYSGDIQEIGKKLNVNYLMEGDLRLERNRIRLSTRLINASDGRVQWQKQYDQDFETIMDLEDDIGDNVVRELRVEVFPDEFLRLRNRITENSEAYKLYLEGSELGQKRNQESLTKAIRLIEEAVVLEPDFARAHAELVILYNLLNNYGDLDRDLMVEKMQYHLEKARDADPDLAEVHLASSRVAAVFNQDTSITLSHIREAIRLNKNYAPAHYALFYTLSRMGYDHSSIKPLQNAHSLDPYNDIYASRLAVAYRYTLNEPEKAMVILDRMLEINPSARACSNQKARLIADAPYGDLAEAFMTIHKTRGDDQFEATQLWYLIYYSLGIDLAPLAERYMKLLQWRFPNNDLVFNTQIDLNNYNNNFKENIDLIGVWNKNERISDQMAGLFLSRTFISLNDFESAETYLDSAFPELSGSLDSISPESTLNDDLFFIQKDFIPIYLAKGEVVKANLILEKMYENNEDWRDYYYTMYPYYYYRGDVDSLVYMLNKVWFENNERQEYRIYMDYRAGVYKDFENNPVFMDFISKVTEETHRQRAEVIEYLKEQGDWDPVWDKELGLE